MFIVVANWLNEYLLIKSSLAKKKTKTRHEDIWRAWSSRKQKKTQKILFYFWNQKKNDDDAKNASFNKQITAISSYDKIFVCFLISQSLLIIKWWLKKWTKQTRTKKKLNMQAQIRYKFNSNQSNSNQKWNQKNDTKQKMNDFCSFVVVVVVQFGWMKCTLFYRQKSSTNHEMNGKFQISKYNFGSSFINTHTHRYTFNEKKTLLLS